MSIAVSIMSSSQGDDESKAIMHVDAVLHASISKSTPRQNIRVVAISCRTVLHCVEFICRAFDVNIWLLSLTVHQKMMMRFLQVEINASSKQGAMAISNVMIIKMSINVFFRSYQSFTSIAAFLVLPASLVFLMSQALLPSYAHVLEAISGRLRSLFRAANFPAACKFFSILNFKLTQTIFSFLFTLPVAITFLLLAKAAIVHVIDDSSSRRRRKRLGFPPLRSLLPLYRAVLATHLLNCVIIFSANSTIFALFFVIFNAVDILGVSSKLSELLLSASGAVLYSVVIANATVFCNLAIVASSMEHRGGCLPVLKACLAVGGRVVAALGLALPANLGMAAVEALFQYRVMKHYNATGTLSVSLLWEALTIAYFHALFIVLEVIMSCLFYKKCRMDCRTDWDAEGDHQRELEPEDKGPHQV